MRLAEFIVEHLDSILTCWDAFARKNEPAALAMDDTALRNHAAQMLRAIAADMATTQTREQSIDKSESRGGADEHSAASTHGAARLVSGFTVDQLLAEYRALRASVLRLWTDQGQATLSTDMDDVMRFNEAIDQAQADCEIHSARSALKPTPTSMGYGMRAGSRRYFPTCLAMPCSTATRKSRS